MADGGAPKRREARGSWPSYPTLSTGLYFPAYFFHARRRRWWRLADCSHKDMRMYSYMDLVVFGS